MQSCDIERIMREERVSWYLTLIFGAILAGYVIAAIGKKP